MADHGDDALESFEDMVRRLIRMMTMQETFNARVTTAIERMDGYMARQDGINERLTASMERLDVTLARIETLLARLPRGETNGRDA